MNTDNKHQPKISIIVAMTDKRVIGRDNDLPWRLPNDLKRFKNITWGKPIVMGRKTFESIGKALPGRRNIVLSRSVSRSDEDVEWFASLAEAWQALADEPEIMIIGGAQLFSDTLPVAERIYLTEVQSDIDGDVLFPEFDRSQWQAVESEQCQADDRHACDYRFVTLERT
ncbi:MAG: type 3 dihydrofolate reductase [Gammaproteobacteria bacterium]|nr:type 3 dihydrofolate reductase [Gammaproteobacteria bacterium]